MRLLSREPGHVELSDLRAEGDLDTLAGYVSDPKSSQRLRRQATAYIASTKPGGGKAAMGFGGTDPAIVPILAPLLENDADRTVRRNAAYGLRRTGDETAVEPLLRALSDTDKATRIHAAMGLGDLHSRAAVEPLSHLLDDPGCARATARALVEIGDERALPALKRAASSARSRRKRKMFSEAAFELERRTGQQPWE
jgi:HEAT repeat protein